MSQVTPILLVALLGRGVTAFAQDPAATQAPSSQPAAAVDASKLGVSFERIKRELAQAEAQAQSDNPLKLEFVVEVFGQAPKIDLLRDFPLIGPSQYGGPTHRDVIDFLTPEEFRSPALPISAIAGWAAQKVWQRSKKARCEEEIAEYKRQVMAGIAVAAPRCTQ
jgi:hypothetical protein